MQFVELLCTDPRAVTDSFFDELRLHFTGTQVAELTYLTLFLNFSHRLGALNHAGPPDGANIFVKPNSFLDPKRGAVEA